MIHIAAWLLVIGAAVYLRWLLAWWPVLDDPEYFIREEMADRQHVAWARGLVVRKRPVRVWRQTGGGEFTTVWSGYLELQYSERDV